MYLFMKASRRSTNMFRFWTFCHERDSCQAGYPTLMRLHGKLSPQLTGLPHLADRATRLGGSPHLSCKRDQNKIRNYMDRRVTPPRRVTSPTWGPPPPCKHALSVVILMEMRFNLWFPLLLWSVQWSWLRYGLFLSLAGLCVDDGGRDKTPTSPFALNFSKTFLRSRYEIPLPAIFSESVARWEISRMQEFIATIKVFHVVFCVLCCWHVFYQHVLWNVQTGVEDYSS